MNGLKNNYILILLIVAAIFGIFHFSEPVPPMLHIPPHIRQIVWFVFLLAGIVLLFIYLQPVFNKNPADKTPGNVVKGKIVDYKTNRIGDIDKVLVDTKQGKVWIHFPPHTAKFVMNTAPKNESGTLAIRPADKMTIDHLPLFELISVQTALGSFLTESVPPPAPAVGNKIAISGAAGRYKLDEKGIVAGIILNQYLVDIPAQMLQHILPVIEASHEMTVKGYERNASDGFVNVTGLIMVKPYAITIDKIDYLL